MSQQSTGNQVQQRSFWISLSLVLLLVLASSELSSATVGTTESIGSTVLEQRRPEGPRVVDAEALRKRTPREKWYIVSLKDRSADPLVVATQTRSLDPSVSAIGFIYEHAINGFSAKLTDRQVDRLRDNSNVLSVTREKYFESSAQQVPIGVKRIEASPASKNSTAKIDGIDERVDVGVAIIDGPVDPTTGDLNLQSTINCTGTGPVTWKSWHATHIAGTIGALDNSSKVVGIAPGARIYSYVVENSAGDSTTAAIICALDSIAQNPSLTPIVNISMGSVSVTPVDDNNCGISNHDTLHQAVCTVVNDKGVTIVASAGNKCKDAKYQSPAAYNEVITVAAITDSDGLPNGQGSALREKDCSNVEVDAPDDQLAPFSSWGDDVDLFAPGVSVLSLYFDPAHPEYTLANASGTSMAAPHVAGAAALYVAANGPTSPSAVRTALLARREQVTVVNPWPAGPSTMNQGIVNINDMGPWGVILYPDVTNPIVAITAPASGKKVKSPVAISVSASDSGGSGLSRVIVWQCTSTTSSTCTINKGTDTSAPYSFKIKAKKTFIFRVEAIDGAGNSTMSEVRSVKIKKKKK